MKPKHKRSTTEIRVRVNGNWKVRAIMQRVHCIMVTNLLFIFSV